MRPFKFHGWQIETSYTHLWNCANPDNGWAKVDVGLQKQISSVKETLSIRTEINEAQIRQFSVSTSKNPYSLYGDKSIHADIIEKRIRWMLQRDLCRILTLNNQLGKELATSLLILSRENRTIYFWKNVCTDKKAEAIFLPFLWWQICLSLSDGFDRIDLNRSSSPAISQLR